MTKKLANTEFQQNPIKFIIFLTYRKVMSTNMCCLEAHPGCYRFLMNGQFDAYIL